MTRVFVLALALACSCTSGVFACGDDEACGQGGTCQPEGWCSFPDANCESGQRFGEHSGAGLAGTCVDPIGTTGMSSADDSDTMPAGSTSSGPVTTLDGPADDSADDALDDTVDDAMTEVDADDGTDASSDGTVDESTGADVLLPDPLAWYSFDDLMDPYKDDSGNGHLTWCADEIGECPIPLASPVGLGRQFDGITQHLHIDHDTWVETTSAMTFASWVWLDAGDGTGFPEFMGIAMKPYGMMLESSTWVIGLDSTNGAIGAIVGQDPLAIAGGPYPFDDQWHHVALSWDGETVRVYVDAEEVGQAAATETLFDGATINLGAGVASGVDAAFLRGALDEIRLYDVGLDAEQIAVLASIPRP